MTFSINHHKKFGEIVNNSTARLNIPEHQVHIEDIYKIIHYATSISASIPNDYQFLMNDKHNIKSPCEDVIFKIIFKELI